MPHPTLRSNKGHNAEQRTTRATQTARGLVRERTSHSSSCRHHDALGGERHEGRFFISAAGWCLVLQRRDSRVSGLGGTLNRTPDPPFSEAAAIIPLSQTRRSFCPLGGES
ncbi:hypothetical protein MTO96_046091 [Rhipicephalus appendiculatus]